MEFRSIVSSSTANLYTVTGDDSTIMIEAGLRGTALKKALNFKLSSMDFCLLTHGDGDHAGGIKDVIGAGVDCYMSAETAYKVMGEQDIDHHRINIIEPLKRFEVDGWIMLPFPTAHCLGSMGFIVQKDSDKLLFVTDSYNCPYRFKELTIIAVECNYSIETMLPDITHVVKDRIVQTHFSLERVISFLEDSDLKTVREIHLLHLSDTNSDEEMFKNKIQELTGIPIYIAQKGSV